MTRAAKARRRRWKWPTRQTVITTAGLFGFFYELFRQGSERPYLLALIAGMIGIPLGLAVESWIRSRGNGRDNGNGR